MDLMANTVFFLLPPLGGKIKMFLDATYAESKKLDTQLKENH